MKSPYCYSALKYILMDEEAEILDLVDSEDKVIGKIKRGDSHRLVSERLGYIRATDMFIRNSTGKIWVPVRTAHKTIAPNGLDYSCGGHVSSGDDYDKTMKREIEEELKFTPDPHRLHFILKMPPLATPYFRAIYIYESDDTPQYNPYDFVGGEWMTPKELLDKLDAGVPAKSSIKETVLTLIELNTI